MCLAIPVEVIEILDGDMAIVNCGGIQKTIATTLVDAVEVGDFVILHVGFALTKLNKANAYKTIDLLNGVMGDSCDS